MVLGEHLNDMIRQCRRFRLPALPRYGRDFPQRCHMLRLNVASRQIRTCTSIELLPWPQYCPRGLLSTLNKEDNIPVPPLTSKATRSRPPTGSRLQKPSPRCQNRVLPAGGDASR